MYLADFRSIYIYIKKIGALNDKYFRVNSLFLIRIFNINWRVHIEIFILFISFFKFETLKIQ